MCLIVSLCSRMSLLVIQPLWCVPCRFILSYFLSLQTMMIKAPPLLQVTGLDTEQQFPRNQVWSLLLMAQWSRPPVSQKPAGCQSVRAPARQLGQSRARWLIRSYLVLQDVPPAQASLQRNRSIVLLSTCQWCSPVTAGTNPKCLQLC